MKTSIATRAAALLLASGAIAGAAVAPITSQSKAARAVATAVLARDDAQAIDYQFAFRTRDDADLVFKALSAATTFQSLLASPSGISLDCPLSGTLTARLENRRPRILKFEWHDCVRDLFGATVELDGPGEIVLIDDSLTPVAVASIRFGDRDRDVVLSTFQQQDPIYIDDTQYRNLRLTGYLPMRRLGDDLTFAKRYTAQVSGFLRTIQRIPDYSTGMPSVERYPFETLQSTSGAVISGEPTHVGDSFQTDFTLVAGTFAERYDMPERPTGPASTLRKSLGGLAFRVQWGFDGDRVKSYMSFDGIAQTDYNQWWGFNCPKPDEFAYRTLGRLETVAEDYTGHMFDTGVLAVNGNATATFTATGTQPFIDRIGHVAFNVRGLGSFSYDVNGFVYGSELFAAARCTP